MDDQLNNEFRDRIIEVFDGYETPAGDADAGWAELRKRFPEKKNRRAAAWWWSSAAAFLVFALFGLWLYNRSLMRNQPALIKNNSKHLHLSDTLHSAPEVLHQQRFQGNTANDQTFAQATHASALAPAATQFSTGKTKSQPGNAVPTLIKQDTTTTLVPSVNYATTQPKQVPSTLANAGVPADTNAYAKTLPALSATINKAAPDSSSNIKHAPTMADLLARDSRTAYKQEQPKSTNKNLIFSIFAGTYVNYAKGSSNQLNAGAGVTSDIRLMKKLKLVTGIAIAQNSLKYNGQPTQPNVYAAAIAATGRANDNSSMRLFSMPSLVYNSNFVSTQVSSYNASFTGLDIPVNLKFELNPDKNDSYISAGISSGTFINETYHYNYTNSLVSATTASAETQTRFGSFDFARTLNFSFGVGTPLGKSNRLIIEPFLKYPLSGLGSQQIRFGASGINLKLRFQTHK